MAISHLYYSQEDTLDILYYPKKINVSYKMYFDDNIQYK